MNAIIVVFAFLLSTAVSDETYQNSSNICEKCECTDGDTFILDCTGRNIQHSLANWPVHDKTLVATFSYNNITTLEILPVCNQTVKLVLDHCNIQNLDNGVFKAIRNIEYVDLSYNLLKTEVIDGGVFKGPYNSSVYYPIGLKYLNLAYNQIHSIPRRFFENMPDLEELNLEGNDFSVLDHNTQLALNSLSKLKTLNLANNELTELVGDAIKNLSSLVDLNLSSNHLDFVPETVAHLGKHLKVLDLSDNLIFEIKDNSFLGIGSLRDLRLDNLPRLEAIYPNAFSTLPNLKKISLRHNINLKSLDREAFSPNQTLIELYLNNNSLEELDHKLLKWSSLIMFDMSDNPLVCDCNLFNVTRDLSKVITGIRDGPICVDPRNDRSRQIYSLDEEICDIEPHAFRIHHVSRHFETIRVITITLSTMLTIGAVIVLVVSFLRYRRGTACRNYNFTAQVSYNPVRTQYL